MIRLPSPGLQEEGALARAADGAGDEAVRARHSGERESPCPRLGQPDAERWSDPDARASTGYASACAAAPSPPPTAASSQPSRDGVRASFGGGGTARPGRRWWS